MTREEVLAKLTEFAAMAYGVDASEIKEDTNLNDLGVASSQRVAMSASIENEFDVMIPVARFGKFDSLGAIVDFVMDEM
jgi:acyl carrier protein